MSLHERFSDEADFRSRFVRPLLNKLGFLSVVEYHGSREFGKDFVFSELHRFGGLRHYAAQVKHEPTIRLGRAVDNLLAQVNQAFANPFVLPNSQHDSFVSSIYIFNSGRISTEAKDDLLRRLGRATYGENVFFLDGQTLEDLDRWSGYQNDLHVRQLLVGLRGQMSINIGIWTSTKRYFREDSSPIEARSAILHGIDEYISRPLLTNFIDVDNAFKLRQWANAIENISVWIMRTVINTDALKKTHAETVIKTCDGAIKAAQLLITQIDSALTELKPL